MIARLTVVSTPCRCEVGPVVDCRMVVPQTPSRATKDQEWGLNVRQTRGIGNDDETDAEYHAPFPTQSALRSTCEAKSGGSRLWPLREPRAFQNRPPMTRPPLWIACRSSTSPEAFA